MSGCPYAKFSFKKMHEECKLTGENVEGFVMCDFEYEECPDYRKAQASGGQAAPSMNVVKDGGLRSEPVTGGGRAE